MKFSSSVIATLAMMCAPGSLSADAFVPDKFGVTKYPTQAFLSESPSSNVLNYKYSPERAAFSSKLNAASTATVAEVETSPIPGMKPGTSGLRKKVEVWQGTDPETKYKYYVENFIQSLLDTAKAKNKDKMLDT